MKIDDFISYEQPANYIVGSDQYVENGKTPVLTAGQSFILGYTDEKDGIYNDFPVVIFDDFTTSVQYVDFPFKVKSSAMKILKNKENANIKFCYYLLSWLQEMPPNHKRQWISTTSQIDINLPSLDEQEEIVKKIEAASNIISNRNRELELFDDLIKARFVELFGHQSHNEKGLSYETIDDVAEIYLGITHTPQYVDSGVIFISAKNTSGDFLDLSDVKYISREEFETAPKGAKPLKGDVLFSRVGSNLGHPVILEDDIELCSFVSLGFLRTKGRVTNNYLKHWMRDDFFAEQVSSHVKGGGQPNLNTGWLKEFKIIVPDIEAQIAFDKFCEQVDKSKFDS